MSDWSKPDSDPLADVLAMKAQMSDPVYMAHQRLLNSVRERMAQVDLLARHVRARHAIDVAMYRLDDDNRLQAWLPIEAYERLLVLAIDHDKPFTLGCCGNLLAAGHTEGCYAR